MDDVVPVEQVGDGGGECRLGGRVGALIELKHEVQVIAAVGAHAADRLEIAGALRPAVRVVLRADVVALGRGEVADDLPRVVPADGRRTEVNVVVAHLACPHDHCWHLEKNATKIPAIAAAYARPSSGPGSG